MWEIKLQECTVKWNVDDNNNINFAAYLGGKVIGPSNINYLGKAVTTDVELS